MQQLSRCETEHGTQITDEIFGIPIHVEYIRMYERQCKKELIMKMKMNIEYWRQVKAITHTHYTPNELNCDCGGCTECRMRGLFRQNAEHMCWTDYRFRIIIFSLLALYTNTYQCWSYYYWWFFYLLKLIASNWTERFENMEQSEHWREPNVTTSIPNNEKLKPKWVRVKEKESCKLPHFKSKCFLIFNGKHWAQWVTIIQLFG